jgi:hypothetical protein
MSLSSDRLPPTLQPDRPGPAPTPRPAGRRRPPWTALVAAPVLALQAAVTCFGSFYFSFVDGSPGVRPWAVVFVAVFWAVNAVALGSCVGLLRGSRLARHLLTGYVSIALLFTLVKIVFFHEGDAVVFGVAALLLLGLVQAPATRRWTS